MNYKLSPSELTYLYEGCKFCFWLKVRHGISQPSMPMPGIFSTIAGLQKDFYGGKLTEEFCKELPRGVVHLGEEWVQSRPIPFPGTKDECFIKGRFDVVVKFDDGSFGVIDFKTSRPTDSKAAMYGRQLQAYAYALENAAEGSHSLSPITKLGLLFFTPEGFEQLDLTNQAFKGKLSWVEIKRDDEQFLQFLREVLKVASAEKAPEPAPDCNWCRYRSRMENFDMEKAAPPKEAVADAGAPECPKCNGGMKLRTGKFGEFWSCMNYPGCRGTRNVVKTP
ncbi:MAG: PD-(D/E)XK nuclease family protein [Candidatus Omnitrophota bacterium]|nr:PD-(D/E)XK nuclease family protein [Candidatus Omnitrophota bacterium]